MVQDFHWDEQIVIVRLPLVLPRHYHRRLVVRLLQPTHTMIATRISQVSHCHTHLQ